MRQGSARLTHHYPPLRSNCTSNCTTITTLHPDSLISLCPTTHPQ